MRLQAVCGFFQDPIRPNFNYNQLLNQFRASLLLKVYSLKNSNPQRPFVFNEVKIQNNVIQNLNRNNWNCELPCIYCAIQNKIIHVFTVVRPQYSLLYRVPSSVNQLIIQLVRKFYKITENLVFVNISPRLSQLSNDGFSFRKPSVEN